VLTHGSKSRSQLLIVIKFEKEIIHLTNKVSLAGYVFSSVYTVLFCVDHSYSHSSSPMKKKNNLTSTIKIKST